MRHLRLLSLLLTLLIGCEQAQQPTPTLEPSSPTAPAPASPPNAAEQTNLTGSGLFHQPSEPVLLELPSEALPHWRTESATKPALVFFSFDPLLKPIDASLRESARKLALTGTPAQLRQHGSYNVAEPLILPIQTVHAALDAGMFSKFYWIFPSKVAPEQLDLARFRSQMEEQRLLNSEELAILNLNAGHFTGSVRGIPFEAIHYQRLSDISEPLVLHIDMSFFRGLYDNEIKAPLYSLLRNAVDSLRGLNWQPLATTLSYSTLEGATSLDVRFMISNLAEMIRNPALLESDMPKDWQMRSEALYAGDMYSESKKIELSQQIAQLAPQSAAAHYDRFQALFTSKQVDTALQALHQAVQLDPGYGAAYIQLAQMAAEDNNIETALELLGRAEPLFPQNPFITLQKAHLLTFSGQPEAAQEHLARLPQNWSPLFHQKVPGAIAELKKKLDDPAVKQESGDEKR